MASRCQTWFFVFSLTIILLQIHPVEMPRRLRIEFEGATYHMMARGNARQKIVRDDADRRRLIEGLEHAVSLNCKASRPPRGAGGRSLAVPPPHGGDSGRARRVAGPFPSRQCPEPHASLPSATQVAD